MNTKNIAITALIGLVIVVLGVVIFRGGGTTPQNGLSKEDVEQIVQRAVKNLGAVSGTGTTSYNGLQALEYLSLADNGTTSFGGVERTYRHGSCLDATNTLFAVKNPFSDRTGSTTVTSLRVDITGPSRTLGRILVATSSFESVSTSSGTIWVSATSTFLADVTVPTSTRLTFFSGQNPATTTSGDPNLGLNVASGIGRIPGIRGATSSLASRFPINVGDYLVGYWMGIQGTTTVVGQNQGVDSTGVTSTSNTFSCDYSIEFTN